MSNAKGLRVRLYGTLSATGKGHGTDRAVIAGLMGYAPSTCPPTLLNDLDKYPKEKKFLALGNKNLDICLKNIEYCSVAHNFPHNNTLIIDLLSEEFDNKGNTSPTNGNDALEKNILFSWEYYSVGGGFLQWKVWTAPKTATPPHKYSNMTELLALCKEKNYL